MFKGGANSARFAGASIIRLIPLMLTTPLVLGGFTCFFISALLWMLALRSGVALSVAYPMVALSYIIIFTGSALLYHEPITWRLLAGAALIVCGVVLIGTA